MSRLNRLFAPFGHHDQPFCCDRCTEAALVAHTIQIKHRLHHAGEPHTDLPEFESPSNRAEGDGESRRELA